MLLQHVAVITESWQKSSAKRGIVSMTVGAAGQALMRLLLRRLFQAEE